MALRPISVEFLEEGMTADDDIYGSNQGVFVLVKKGTVLTANMVRRLQEQVKVSRNIYVSEDTYKKLMEEGIPKSLTQKNIEKETGYDILRESAKDMMDSLTRTGKVDVKEAEKAIETISQKAEEPDNSAMLQCINGIRLVDEYLYTHSMNVSFLNALIAKWLGMPEEEIHTLATVGMLHDLGKTKISQNILHKPGSLTKEEFNEMKEHPDFSVKIIKAAGIEDPDVLSGVLQHHEKTNGMGYPSGLRGDEISLYGKITAISDVYDAMVAKRVYKNEQSPFDVLETFTKDKVSDLDYEIVNLFLKKMPSELLGKRVLLSDGSIGKVSYIDIHNYAKPIIDVDGELITTGKEIKVLRMII